MEMINLFRTGQWEFDLLSFFRYLSHAKQLIDKNNTIQYIYWYLENVFHCLITRVCYL